MIMNHITFILIFEQPVRCILRITSDIAVPYLLLLFEKKNFRKQYCDNVVAIGNIFTITIETLILFITKFNWSLILSPTFFYCIINL